MSKHGFAGSVLALALLAFSGSPAHADPYAVGSTVAAVEIPDQHGAAARIDESLRAVVFSRDMKAGDVVKAAVEKAGPNLFERNGAAYVVDVKGMPALVRALFAMPAIRRRPYKVLVDYDGSKTADLPGGATYPTVLVLDKLKVVGLSYPTTADELIAALEPAAAGQTK